MKCIPMTRSGRPDAAAILVIEIEDVLDARIASSLHTSPRLLKIASFSSSFSGAASMTTSQSCRSLWAPPAFR